MTDADDNEHRYLLQPGRDCIQVKIVYHGDDPIAFERKINAFLSRIEIEDFIDIKFDNRFAYVIYKKYKWSNLPT